MPASDYALMQAYYAVEPFGTKREDWHHARGQALVANYLGGMMYAQGMIKQKKTFSPKDFTMPRQKTDAQKINSVRATLEMLAAQGRGKAHE